VILGLWLLLAQVPWQQRLQVDHRMTAREAEAVAQERNLEEQKLRVLLEDEPVDPREVDAYLRLLEKQFPTASVRDTFLEALGLTPEQLQDEARFDLKVFHLLDRLYARVVPADSEEVWKPRERYYSQVFVPAYPEASVPERLTAWAVAWAAWLQLKAGATPEEVARRFPGLVSVRRPGKRPAVYDPHHAWSRRLFDLPVGRWTLPERVRNGYRLLRVEQEVPARPARYGDLPYRVRRKIVKNRLYEAFQRFIETGEMP